MDHLADLEADLAALGRDDDYIYNLRVLITRLVRECGWLQPKDVTPASFRAWRRRQTKAPKTMNEYLASMNRLLNWMVTDGRLPANPLRSVELCETRGRERRRRRALTDAEIRNLLPVAGPRRIVYLTAVMTGLRRGELAGLVWRDFRLDVDEPFVVVRASISKNHRKTQIKLHPVLLDALRAYRPTNAKPTDKVFPEMPTMAAYKADLEAAGIPYKDDEERQADFHALRKTFATRLIVAKVEPRVVMDLMRHGDIRLTMNEYTDTALLPTGPAIDRLPGF